MTRHGRNATNSSVYTYHERRKDSKSSGFGSKVERIGKDSVRDFDCCCLTLQPCRDPVITPDGYLYDKEAILSYILHQKREIARKLKEYEKQKTKLQKEEEELARAEYESRVQNFKSTEERIVRGSINDEESSSSNSADATSIQPGTSGPASSGPGPSTSATTTAAASSEKSICNMRTDKKKVLPSFWVPNLTPSAKPTLINKPDEKVRCPNSGKALRLKDLIPVHFTPIADRDTKTALIVKSNRYVCAVTNDVLGNCVQCCVLRTSGSVVTQEAVDKLLRKDMLDPINGKQMTEKDIIPLMGATGFAGGGQQLIAKKKGIAMPLA